MAKNKTKTYDWELLREQFKSYPHSYAAFAREKGIADSTAYKHLRDLIELKSSTDNGITSEDEEPLDFLPIEVVNEADLEVPEVTFIKTQQVVDEPVEQISTPIELKVRDFSITLTSGFDKNALKDVLEVMNEVC